MYFAYFFIKQLLDNAIKMCFVLWKYMSDVTQIGTRIPDHVEHQEIKFDRLLRHYFSTTHNKSVTKNMMKN